MGSGLGGTRAGVTWNEARRGFDHLWRGWSLLTLLVLDDAVLPVLDDAVHTVWAPGISRARQAGFREAILLRELLGFHGTEGQVSGSFLEPRALDAASLRPLVRELEQWLCAAVTLPQGCRVSDISAATSGSAHWPLLRECMARLSDFCDTGGDAGTLLRRTATGGCWWCGRKLRCRDFFEAPSPCVCGESGFHAVDVARVRPPPAADPLNLAKRRPGSGSDGLERPKRRAE